LDEQRLPTAAKTTASAKPTINGCDAEAGVTEPISSDREQASMAAATSLRHVTRIESTGGLK
jgi:hypothetical protein